MNRLPNRLAAIAQKHSARSADAAPELTRQLDIGTYKVAILDGSNTTVVGVVYVEEIATDTKVEHYVMFNNFQPPAGSEKMQIELHNEQFDSMSEFLDELQNFESTLGPYTYIKATCVESVGLPL